MRHLYMGLDFEVDWSLSAKPRKVKMAHIVEQFVRSTKSWPQLQPGMDLKVGIERSR